MPESVGNSASTALWACASKELTDGTRFSRFVKSVWSVVSDGSVAERTWVDAVVPSAGITNSLVNWVKSISNCRAALISCVGSTVPANTPWRTPTALSKDSVSAIWRLGAGPGR